MADNLGITVGTDANVATDDCGASGHFQRIKLDKGGDGVSSPVVAGSGLPVGVESLPGTVATDITAIKTAVEVLDNAISGSEMQVDVVAALPAGANNIGSVNVADVVPGTGATNLGKAEDAAHTTGDVGVMALSVRTNTATARGGTDGDYQPLITDTNGRLHVITGPSTSTIEVVGDGAHDAAIAGNPVRVAGRAMSADYTAVTSGDTADLLTDLLGKIVIMPYAINQNHWQAVTAAKTDTSDTAIKASAGAGLRNYITSLTVTNSHATVGTVVEVKDGSTVIHRGYAAPAGGGYTQTFPTPLKGTAATAINVANITTGSNTYVSMSGYTAP